MLWPRRCCAVCAALGRGRCHCAGGVGRHGRRLDERRPDRPVELLVLQPGLPPRPVSTSVIVPVVQLSRLQAGATLGEGQPCGSVGPGDRLARPVWLWRSGWPICAVHPHRRTSDDGRVQGPRDRHQFGFWLYSGPQSVRVLDERRGPCPRLSFTRPGQFRPHSGKGADTATRPTKEVTDHEHTERVRALVEPLVADLHLELTTSILRRCGAGHGRSAQRRRHGCHRVAHRALSRRSTNRIPSTGTSPSRCPVPGSNALRTPAHFATAVGTRVAIRPSRTSTATAASPAPRTGR